MLNEGFVIMLSGMLVVFVFLILMVLSMTALSKICLSLFPDKPETTNKSNGREPEIAIAIAAAYIK